MSKFQKKFFFYAFLIFIFALIYVFEQVQSKIMLRHINKVNIEKTNQLEICSKLKKQYAKLVFPERLYEIAKKNGFVIPKEKDIINIKEDETDKQ